MTGPQRNMLFRMFYQAMAKAGVRGKVAQEAERERLTIRVFNAPVSWSTFKDPEVDRMKAELLALLKPADANAQLRQIQMPRTRLLYAIERAADPAYTAKIVFDKFGTRDIEDLDDEQLAQIRMTLQNRGRSKARKQFEHRPRGVRGDIVVDECVPDDGTTVETPF